MKKFPSISSKTVGCRSLFPGTDVEGRCCFIRKIEFLWYYCFIEYFKTGVKYFTSLKKLHFLEFLLGLDWFDMDINI